MSNQRRRLKMKLLIVHASTQVPARRRKGLFPSLTLAHLASLFPLDWDITLCDESVEDFPAYDKFDLVGVTFYGSAAPRAFSIAEGFRSRGIPVIFGGPGATTLPDLCRQRCDSLVVGEAEEVIPQILHDIQSGDLKPSYSSERLPSISSLPIPRYDLLDPKHYMGVFPVQTARGCTFRCSFCSIPQLNHNTVRYRPIDDVVRDIRAAIKASGSNRIFFVDDHINMNPKRSIELFEAIAPLRIEWYSYATSIISRQSDVLRLAADSGCRMLFIGFESLNQNRLRLMNKQFNLPQGYNDTIATIHDHGIHIMPSFIFGLDGEDSSVFQETLDFVESNHLSFPMYHILTPIPGTELFRSLEEDGRLITDDLAHFDGKHVVYQPSSMTADELRDGFEWIVGSTYGLRSILRRTLLHV